MEGELWKQLDSELIRNIMWALFFFVGLIGCLRLILGAIHDLVCGRPGVYELGDKVYFLSEGLIRYSTVQHIEYDRNGVAGYHLDGMVGKFGSLDLYMTYRGARKENRRRGWE